MSSILYLEERRLRWKWIGEWIIVEIKSTRTGEKKSVCTQITQSLYMYEPHENLPLKREARQSPPPDFVKRKREKGNWILIKKEKEQKGKKKVISNF